MTDEEKRASKARAAELKVAAKQEKEAERAKKAEEDRVAREEKRKSKEAPAAAPVAGSVPARASSDNGDLYEEPPMPMAAQTSEHDSADPTSPTSQSSSTGFKSLLNKLKRRSKHASSTEATEESKEKDAGFIGGAALRTPDSGPHSQSSKSASQPQRDSSEAAHVPTNLGDVEPFTTTATTPSTNPTKSGTRYVPHVGDVQYSDVSSLSSDDEDEIPRGRSAERIVSGSTVKSGGTDFEEAKDHFDADLAPPPTFTSDAEKARKGSPVRDSKFHEVGI